MTFWVFGATGMLGRQLLAEGKRRGKVGVGIARSGGDLNLDLSEESSWEVLRSFSPPDLVVNAAAITDLMACEKEPGLALDVNAGIPKRLAELSKRTAVRIAQISTDHFYSGNGRLAHGENFPIEPPNQYAVSKALAEKYIIAVPGSLVIRTNLVGFRLWDRQPTFVEWALSSILKGQPITGFSDFYTSSLDVKNFSVLFWELESLKPTGVLNLASSSVASKFEFLIALAERFGLPEAAIKEGSLGALSGPKRANSLGLDTTKVQVLLGRPMPDMAKVIESLWQEFQSDSRIRSYLQSNPMP